MPPCNVNNIDEPEVGVAAVSQLDGEEALRGDRQQAAEIESDSHGGQRHRHLTHHGPRAAGPRPQQRVVDAGGFSRMGGQPQQQLDADGAEDQRDRGDDGHRRQRAAGSAAAGVAPAADGAQPAARRRIRKGTDVVGSPRGGAELVRRLASVSERPVQRKG